jgi:DNA polymerase III delta' subunit
MKPLLNPLAETNLTALIQKPKGSYLFAGPAGLGKFTAAIWVVQQVNCKSKGCLSCATCQAITHRNYPDLVILEPTGPSIGIEQVYGVTQALGLSRYYTDGKRVVIVDEAHLLTLEAQNALLKTLEEPPLGTVIILVSHMPERLLPTILSRTMRINFALTNRTLTKNYLTQAYGVEPAMAAEVLELTRGHIGLAIKLTQDENLRQSYVEVDQTAENLLKSRLFDRLCSVPKLLESDKGSELLILALARKLQTRLRQVAQKDPGALQGVSKQLSALERYQRYRASNVSPRAALEGLMLEI